MRCGETFSATAAATFPSEEEAAFAPAAVLFISPLWRSHRLFERHVTQVEVPEKKKEKEVC